MGSWDVGGAVVVDGGGLAHVRTGVGLAQAAGVGSCRDVGSKAGAVEGDLGAGLTEAGFGGLEVLIGGGDLRL